MKKTKTSRIIGNFYTEPKNKHTIELTKLIYKQYLKLISENDLNQKKCTILLNLNEESPILTYDNLPKIILPTKDNLWCQIIFQLSHEICHYIFRFKREDQYKKMPLTDMKKLYVKQCL